MSKLHRLLKRQLKKANFDESQLKGIDAFLAQINDAYVSFEQDHSHLEHVLEESSQELFVANQQLKNKVKSIQGKLSKVATNIKDIIFEMDINGRWTYLNSAWERLSGFTIEESLGKEYYEYLPKEVTEAFRKKLIYENENFELYRSSFTYVRPDGITLWLDVSIKPIVRSNGEVEGYIGSISDITELKIAEQKLIDANKAKDEFLSIMSHEIRTPLNAVIGVSNLLLMEEPKPDQIDNLNVLTYSSKHLLTLVNDILDYNKIVSGSLVMEQDDFSLKESLKAQHQMFSQKATSKGLDFKVNLDKDIPKTVIGDTHRLSQILTNLLGNAIKFTEEGFVELEVSLKKKKNDLYFVEFKVSDTGIGIAKENQGKIFEPFAQANSNTTRLFGGTGLGLAICKNLVEIMGSELKCRSGKNVGTSFSFVVPFGKGNSLESVNLSQQMNAEYENSLDGTILVVEDNKINVIIIKKFLDKWGINYEIAENGLIGFEMSVKKQYDLIFMDIEMPVMNGFQATLAIRESSTNPNYETPIIALTASTGDKTNGELSRAGMDGLVVKPFDPKELYTVIKNCLAMPQIEALPSAGSTSASKASASKATTKSAATKTTT
ncbi:ATP-binding protein [uncultured Croceitalea sp.]|uniref:PAS domain-containing hybrid sensor histidine kinase/response regulator n=1 Tax=uncultured Croceitalea sp. TaxID=1798908 RepID=UPI0033060761